MKQALLDTNFIVTCARQKIDFFEELPLQGIEILIPKQVIKEIEKLSKSRKSASLREEADLAMKILNRNKFTEIKLKRKNVDDAIVEFADENPGVIIATLDKELKERIKNSEMVIRGRKKIEIL